MGCQIRRRRAIALYGRLAMLGIKRIPLALTALRALLAPVVIVLALAFPNHLAFAICLVTALLSDIFDGILARRLGVATVALRRLDSVADTMFYCAATFAVWHLHPTVIVEYRLGLVILVGLEVLRYAVDLYKFRREASYHMWSSKLWGLALFAGFLSLLSFGVAGFPVAAAIFLGILADLEGLAISLVLPEWRTDVPSVVHALRLRGDSG